MNGVDAVGEAAIVELPILIVCLLSLGGFIVAIVVLVPSFVSESWEFLLFVVEVMIGLGATALDTLLLDSVISFGEVMMKS